MIIQWLLAATYTMGASSFHPFAGDGTARLREARTDSGFGGVAEVEHGFDVLHYDLFLVPDEANEFIQGTCTIRCRVTEAGLESIGLHLEGLSVEAVEVGTEPADWTHEGDSLVVVLPNALGVGDTTSVRVVYGGTPTSGFHFSRRYGRPAHYTYNAPYEARHWFPCWDLPGDKATARMRVVAPTPVKVYGNGRLETSTPGTDGTHVWVWTEDHPIATYLMSLAMHPYATLRDTADVSGFSVPIHHEVFPEDSTDAVYDFENVPEMLRYFAEYTDTPYPFDKYGLAEVPGLGGAMENQSAVSIGSSLITGRRSYEDIVAHETAHMWFGDLVTPEDFRDVWLNEGFATYWDGMFTGQFYGPEAFADRIEEFRAAERSFWNDTPIFDPPLPRIYSSIEYEKAALVLHMLRFVMGDDSFRDAVRSHVREATYGHATTETFRGHCETSHGSDLGWFFDQWIYGAGKPDIRYSWRHSSPDTVEVVLDQVGIFFRTPMPLRLIGESDSLDVGAEQRDPLQSFKFFVPFSITRVTADPNHWILAEINHDPVGFDAPRPPDSPNQSAQFAPPIPNPFNPHVTLRFTLESKGLYSLTIHDTAGRKVKQLGNGFLDAGTHLFSWDGTNDTGRTVASGTYFTRLEFGGNVHTQHLVLIR